LANTYNVAPADIAAELPGLFPGGFSATTTPTDAQVQGFIDMADTIVTLRITDTTGQAPALSDRAAPLAKRFIIETAKGIVVRLVYAGRDPNFIAASAGPYDVMAKTAIDAIGLLGSQAIGTGEAAPMVSGHMTSRPLIIESWDLDGDHGCSAYWPGDRGRY
jgi:hypothetical protein